MNAIIDAAFSRGRVVALLFAMILLMGGSAYISIPKEAEPDIAIPTIYVSMSHEGISPDDAEQLLVRPMEKELQSIVGIKHMRATAAEGHASVTLEFDAGFDADRAIQDVREKVDIAKAELPADTDEPRVHEINVALFPVLTVVLSGNTSERALLTIARHLKDGIEARQDILEASIRGARQEVLEIIATPSVMEAYNISFVDLFNLLSRNNRLIAAGALDTEAGRMTLTVPGVIDEIDDIMSLPVKVHGDTVIKFKDVATLRRTFKDPVGFARVDGQPALVIDISKRSGANIIQAVEGVHKVVEAQKPLWPANVRVSYIQDKSTQIRTILSDLQNNVVTAVILVMLVIIAALGLRPAVLVGLAIPGAFLAGILVLNGMGLTLNIVVLFSLILVVGMLVDGAIVTIELADRKISEGNDRYHAYAEASKRMAWPIISATCTTLAVFLPLLFWPGVVGEFMKFLPITVIATLLASLAMALIFIPVLGGLFNKLGGGNRYAKPRQPLRNNSVEISQNNGFTTTYIKHLDWILKHPAKIFSCALALLIAAYAAYGSFGKGIEFFPESEPDYVQLQVLARGDLSIVERDNLVTKVEKRLLGHPEIKTIYTRTLGGGSRQNHNMPPDSIGIIQIEFIQWRDRRPVAQLLPELRALTKDIPGVLTQIQSNDSGPSDGKPVQIEISSTDSEILNQSVERLRDLLMNIGGFVDIEDSRPLPSIAWRLNIDREQAALYGADATLLGNAVKMVSTGIKMTEYRPDDTDEVLDVILRYPASARSLERIHQLKVPTERGLIPIDNFTAIEPTQKTGTINRTDGNRAVTVKADVEEGLLVDDQLQKVKKELMKIPADPRVNLRFRGQDEDQNEAAAFLKGAFITALFLVLAILVTQFNSFYQSILVLSAVIFSTTGVLIGLLITNQPFGIVMCGIGLIALAGIVVNNNIVLIDTYNEIKQLTPTVREAILITAEQRLRPVILTSITTVLGLLPMVFGININLIDQEITIGAPSAQMWAQLATAIAGGLSFATLLTLVITPCLLMIGENVSTWLRSRTSYTSRHRTGLEDN